MKVNDIIKNKYLVLEYNSIEEPVRLQCLKCKNTFYINAHYASRIKEQTLCPFCEVTKKNCTKEQAIFKLNQIGEKYDILDFTNGLTDAKVCHLPCNNIIEHANLSRIISRNSGHCLYCSHQSKPYTTEFVKDEINKLTNGEYSVLGIYEREDKPFLIRHEKCGHTWMVRRRNFVYKGTRCPKCITKLTRSKGAKFINGYLTLNIASFKKTDCEVTFSECKDKRSLPFDFYLRALNTLIEYDGEMHFHKMRLSDTKKSLQKLQTTHKHDLMKNNYCSKNKINLLRIPYDTSKENIQKILNELITTQTLSSTTIETYNLYYNKENTYYTRYDEDYVE